jgi:epoxyqueuosine reductase
LAIEPDEPVADHCGSCTACLDACPTAAFPAPYEMDASRCISYLTIEHRGEIPAELHRAMGSWIFGCDVCQDVCPHNRRAPLATEPRLASRRSELGPRPDARSILAWSSEDYATSVRGAATARATHAMWRRNAEIVVGNAGGACS